MKTVFGDRIFRDRQVLLNFTDKLLVESLGKNKMESVAYILVLACAVGVLFFAIAFREPPRIEK